MNLLYQVLSAQDDVEEENPTMLILNRLRVSVNLHPPLRVTTFLEDYKESTLPTGHPDRQSSSANQTSLRSFSLELCIRPATKSKISARALTRRTT